MKFIIPEGIDFLRWTGACCTHVLMKIHFCGCGRYDDGVPAFAGGEREQNSSGLRHVSGQARGSVAHQQGFSVFFSGRCGRGDSFPCAHRPFREPSQSGEEGVPGECVQHVRHARPLPDHAGGRRPHPRSTTAPLSTR